MDAADIGHARPELFAQRERGLDRGVAAPTAGIGLEHVADAHEIVAPAEVLERLQRHLEPAPEGLEIAGTALERLRMRGEAAACQ